MVIKKIELTPQGDLIVDQDALQEAGLVGHAKLIIQSGEIRIVSNTESKLDEDEFPIKEHLAQIDREQEAYEAQHSQIFQKYTGQYIAMHHGKVVDYDTDRVALSKRIRIKYGNEPILITSVSKEARQTITVRSPRLLEYGT